MSAQDPISAAQASLSEVQLVEILRKRDWVFDPVPPWLTLNREQLDKFAKMQVDFKIKELQIQQEKLQVLREMM